MRHKVRKKFLNRTSSHRSAMISNMAVALVLNEQIYTTLAKAKFVRPFIEKMITKGKKNSLAARRGLLSTLPDKSAVTKIIDILSKRYVNRMGGYLRIVKAGFRYGDNAAMAYIEFVERDISAKGSVVVGN